MENRFCKRCLLRDMEQADKAMIEKYKDAIKACDKVNDAEYERRLQICLQCDKLNAGTCNACGCYVELRAAAAMAHCPYGKW